MVKPAYRYDEMLRGRHHVARHVDERPIRQAIEAVERRTTGSVHVTIAPHIDGDVRSAAEKAFFEMQLRRNPHRNSVLIFVVPSRKAFAVVGDSALHEKTGQDFWDRLAATISDGIRERGLTAGIVAGIEEAGKVMTSHFAPRAATPEKAR
jgi:uncharacterized membrane protein